jgi:hypothetical protein
VCWFRQKAKLSEEISLWLLLNVQLFLNIHKHSQSGSSLLLIYWPCIAVYPLRVVNNSTAHCSVLVHVLFSAMLSCSFSPVDRIHPWRARKSSQQGARDVPIHENLLAGCYFARTCMFGNPRPLEFLT